MASTAHPTAVNGLKPVLCEMEVSELAHRLGRPVRRTLHLRADRYLRAQRWRKVSDRRAEVVFAMQDPNGYVWVHAKQHYPSHIFRLPSGGIHWHESVEAALWREVAEETALPAEISRFLGVIEYCIHDGERTAEFASYIFVLRTEKGKPQPHAEEMVSEFRRILPAQLRDLAADLRNLIGDRRGWGQFRALSHDLVYEHLSG